MEIIQNVICRLRSGEFIKIDKIISLNSTDNRVVDISFECGNNKYLIQDSRNYMVPHLISNKKYIAIISGGDKKFEELGRVEIFDKTIEINIGNGVSLIKNDGKDSQIGNIFEQNSSKIEVQYLWFEKIDWRFDSIVSVVGEVVNKGELRRFDFDCESRKLKKISEIR